MQIKFECEHCGQHLTVEASSASQAFVCPNCKKEVLARRGSRPATRPVEEPPPPLPLQPEPEHIPPEPEHIAQAEIYPVTIVDINIGFASMVRFMVKWALASVPACLLLTIVFFVVGFVLWLMVAVFTGELPLMKH